MSDVIENRYKGTPCENGHVGPFKRKPLSLDGAATCSLHQCNPHVFGDVVPGKGTCFACGVRLLCGGGCGREWAPGKNDQCLGCGWRERR